MSAKQGARYDIVFSSGRVTDPETYLDGQMRVGITGDRIMAVSEMPRTRPVFIARRGTVNIAAVQKALIGCQVGDGLATR